ncbi:MAG: class II aldolase/adducin family protein [Chloroflexi bacterium]|nr:class II aldolase/adducin family protein [Chloroflexota bacterium]
MSNQTMEELREKVAISCRIMGSQGITRGSLGHVSARIPGTDHVLIKAKGPEDEALEFVSLGDIILIDLDGRVVEAPEGLDPPAETAMHLAVYRKRPEVGSVIHTHPFWAIPLLAAGKPLVPIFGGYDGGWSIRMLTAGIPVYPKSKTITDNELGADFISVMGDKDACLLVGHGMTTAGASVEAATSNSVKLFELLRLNYMTYAIGTPSPVPDLKEQQDRIAQGTGPRRVRTNAAGEPADWRHYKKMLSKAGQGL